MARIQIELTGITPLVCHNAQLADPDHRISREIAEINAKKSKKTEDDRLALKKLEWFGGLYLNGKAQGPVIPTTNIRKCMIQAGKMTREGTDVARAVLFTELHVPIIYEGPRDVEELWELEEFRYETVVGVKQNRIVRMRPVFPEWVIIAQAELNTSAMDFDRFVKIAEDAGLVEGLGDNRINGFGRFSVNVKKV